MKMCNIVSAVGLGAALAGAAQGQLIRPNSATATSEHSSPYLIVNTINGSGLPANFTLTDSHADYAANNHWTTQAGHTVGESATFTFNSPQTLGAIHVWNHRSNNIASNSRYEPILFDLVLFDGPNGTGNTLATFTSISLMPDMTIAQTRVFGVTAGVRSARFIVRMTEFLNSSPYTGLAEVAFGPCQPISVSPTGQPQAVSACPGEAASFVITPGGMDNLAYQWQWQAGDSTEWTDMVEGANPPAGQAIFGAAGSTSRGVTVYGQPLWPTDANLRFRARVTNPCSEFFSQVVPLVIDPADMGTAGGLPGRDGEYDNNDFIAFINYFFEQDPAADLGRAGGLFGPDGVFDNNDFIAFINEFFAAC